MVEWRQYQKSILLPLGESVDVPKDSFEKFPNSTSFLACMDVDAKTISQAIYFPNGKNGSFFMSHMIIPQLQKSTIKSASSAFVVNPE